MLRGSQSQSGFGEEKQFLHLPGIEPTSLGRPVRSTVTVLTELSRFLYFYSTIRKT